MLHLDREQASRRVRLVVTRTAAFTALIRLHTDSFCHHDLESISQKAGVNSPEFFPTSQLFVGHLQYPAASRQLIDHLVKDLSIKSQKTTHSTRMHGPSQSVVERISRNKMLPPFGKHTSLLFFVPPAPSSQWQETSARLYWEFPCMSRAMGPLVSWQL